jgi:hypothetical protein
MPRQSKLNQPPSHKNPGPDEDQLLNPQLRASNQNQQTAATRNTELGNPGKRQRLDLGSGSGRDNHSLSSVLLGTSQVPQQPGPSQVGPAPQSTHHQEFSDTFSLNQDLNVGVEHNSLQVAFREEDDWVEPDLQGHQQENLEDPDEDPALTPQQQEVLEDLDDDDCEDLMEEICRELEAKRTVELYQALGMTLAIITHIHLCITDLNSASGDLLAPEIIDALRIANWKIKHHSTRMSYEHLRWIVGERITLFSEYKIFQILTSHSHVSPDVYHCCVNSCVLFTGRYAEAQSCPYCKSPRYKSGTQSAQNRFLYYPLIPRLQAFYSKSKLSDTIRTYRSTYPHNTDMVSDVFDGSHYRSLLTKRVAIEEPDGEVKHLPHTHFSDPRDVALAMFSDSYQLFKKSRTPKSATPMILVNLNLPPTARTRLENLLCLGVIPGPHTPKDYNSFFHPAYLELLRLSKGEPMIDYSTGQSFLLHAYVLYKGGDLPDQAKFLGYKGHSAKCPCTHCLATGVRILSLEEGERASTNYYIPLRPPIGHPEETPTWDPAALPLRTDEVIKGQLYQISTQQTKRAREQLAMQYGLNGSSLLERLSSFSRAVGAPHDIMHLLFEHMIPMLIQFWKGQYAPWKTKNLDRNQPYVISDKDWEDIGILTSQASNTIPATFSRALPNLHTEQYLYIAETYCVWFTYLAPALLQNRWPSTNIYYDHAMLLVKIVKKLVDYDIPRADLEAGGQIRLDIIKFVEQYYE